MNTNHDINFSLWLTMMHGIPIWEFAIAGIGLLFAFLFFLFHDLTWMHKFGLFHSFEHLKIKKKDIDKAFLDTTYIEITIPRDSQATAFQIQQKILKAFHSVYADPIEGQHNFSRTFYLFQKMYRLWNVRRTTQAFFTMQIFAQYPYISFRLQVPTSHFHRIEKAIFNAYANAEITPIDKRKTALNSLEEWKCFSTKRRIAS